MMVATVIETYNIEASQALAPEDRIFWWKSAIIPKSTTELKVQERQKYVV